MTRHLLDIESLPHGAAEEILNRAARMAASAPRPGYAGKAVFNLFFEDSTRTRMSFELAAKKLGLDVVNFSTSVSSMKKGESLYDTLATLAAMKPDAIVLRHAEYNAPRFAASIFGCPVVNAGDSWRAHPTQALVDALTIREVKDEIKGLTIAICGDIAHSRVARSNYILLSRLGANVRIVAPKLLMPQEKEFAQAARFDSLDEGIKGADIIMMLRLQKERMERSLIASDADYFGTYGLTAKRLELARPDVYVMHPGPMNRNVEISDEVADDPQRSLILKQVALGVPVRMAVLDWVLNG